MPIAPEMVIDALRRIKDPDSTLDLIRNDMIRDLQLSEDAVAFTVIVSDPGSTFAKELPAQASRVIKEAVGEDAEVRVFIDSPMIGIGNELSGGGGQSTKHDFNRASVIAIASGKGRCWKKYCYSKPRSSAPPNLVMPSGSWTPIFMVHRFQRCSV